MARQRIDVLAEAFAKVRSGDGVAVHDEVHRVLHEGLGLFKALGLHALLCVGDLLVQVAHEVNVFRREGPDFVSLCLVDLQEGLHSVDVVDHVVVLVDGASLGVQATGLVHVATEGTEFVVVLDGQGTVDVHHPFIHVASHVVQPVIVGGVLVDVHGDVAEVVQRTSHTHVVTVAFHEVGVDGAVSCGAAVPVPDEVSVPRVRPALGHQFANAVPDQAQRCEFPFCFGGQAVGRQQHAVFHFDVSEVAVDAVAGQAFTQAFALVLARQVGLCGEVLFVHLGVGVVHEQALTNEDAFVHPV